MDAAPSPLDAQATAPANGQERSGIVVVGLGASAGGVEALESFFADLPATDGVAFLVVLHLDPDTESHLSDILQSNLPLPVIQVSERVAIERGHVYVVPPGQNLLVEDGHVVLQTIEEERILRRPVDHLFRTLGDAYGEHAVAVVLSGTGHDGTVGAQRIRERGGLVLAQEPSDAGFDEMPRSAIDAGVVDRVVTARALGPEVVAYVKRLGRGLPAMPESLPENGARALQSILGLIRERTGHDFSHYKRSTILRRVDRRLHATGMATLADYAEHLRDHPAETDTLLADLLISVTQFFRDAEAFSALESAIPGLFEGKGPRDCVRVWVPGCATGEEAYSIAMLLLAHAAQQPDAPAVQVFATDLNEAAVQTARTGVYPASIKADVSSERLRRFFVHERDHYRVSEPLREAVLFASHSLIKDPPFSQLDLVSCRNVLIYLQRELQHRVLRLFHYALRPGGLLLLGFSELADGEPPLFSVIDKTARLFRRLDVETSLPDLPNVPRAASPRATARATRTPPPSADWLDIATTEPERVHRALRDAAAPPSVLVDRNGDVLHVSSEATPFLRVGGGTPTRSLVKLLRPELRLGAHAVLVRAQREHVPATAAPVALEGRATMRFVAVGARPAPDGECTLMVFLESEEATVTLATGDEDHRASALGTEALDLREQLVVASEEFDTSREELRAQNEELQSINEELRSTAEELETSKEEAKSIAEELLIANDELKAKVLEASQARGDLENLIASTDITTLFLDRELRIQWFTPSARAFFHILPADIGRPLADFAQTFGGAPLVADAKAVLETLEVREREAQGPDGNWFLIHARVYRTPEDKIEGVVLTFVDITTRKENEAALRDSEEQMRRMAEAVPTVLFEAAPDGRVKFVTPQMGTFASSNSGEIEGSLLWPDLIHPKDRERAAAAWAHACADASDLFELRYRLLTNEGPRWVLTRAQPACDAQGTVVSWFGTVIDIDGLARSEAEVRRLSSRIRAAEQAERNRLAQLLHDDLQQQLVALGMTLGLIRLEPDTDGADFLNQASGILGTAVELTRTLAAELAPPTLGRLDLVETFQWLAERQSADNLVDIDVAVNGPVPVADDDVRGLLYSATRELLLNVTKHAGTRKATISAWLDGDYVSVEVKDEGSGFNANDNFEGLGLPGMRERLEVVGGHVDVESAPGKGTRVRLTAPSGS